MATGKPIVYAGKGLAAETVDRIGCGVSVAPGEGAAIAEAVRTLLQDAGRMDEMGRKGRAFIEAGADRETAFEELAKALRGSPGVEKAHCSHRACDGDPAGTAATAQAHPLPRQVHNSIPLAYPGNLPSLGVAAAARLT